MTPSTTTTTVTPSQAQCHNAAERNRFALLAAAEEERRANDAAALEKRFPNAGRDKCKATLELADGDFQKAVAIMSDLEPQPTSPRRATMTQEVDQDDN